MKSLRLPAFRRVAALAVFGILLALAAPLCRAQSPISIYARFSNGTGVWAGESTEPGRTGWTNLREFSFGADNPSSVANPAGAVSFRAPALKKLVDRLSPQLFVTLALGAPLNLGTPNADLTVEFVRVVNSNPVVFFRVELRQLYINGLSSAGVDGEDTLEESVTLSSAAMRFTHWIINPNGTQGASVTKTWNVASGNQNF